MPKILCFLSRKHVKGDKLLWDLKGIYFKVL